MTDKFELSSTQREITKEEALELLEILIGTEEETGEKYSLVHTNVDGGFAILGADWELPSIETLLDNAVQIIYEEDGGINNHDVGVFDGKKIIFLECKPKS